MATSHGVSLKVSTPAIAIETSAISTVEARTMKSVNRMSTE